MKSTLIVLLLACPLIAQGGQVKVHRKAKTAVQKRVAVARPAPQARKVANANVDALKMLQQTTIEIDEGD